MKNRKSTFCWLYLLLVVVGLSFSACQEEEKQEEVPFTPVGEWQMAGLLPKDGARVDRSFLAQLKNTPFELVMALSLRENGSSTSPFASVVEPLGFTWHWAEQDGKITVSVDEGSDWTSPQLKQAMGPLYASFVAVMLYTEKADLEIRDKELYWPVNLIARAEQLVERVDFVLMKSYLDKTALGRPIGLLRYAGTVEGKWAKLRKKIEKMPEGDKKVEAEAKLAELARERALLRRVRFRYEGIKDAARDAKLLAESYGMTRDDHSYFVLRRVGEPKEWDGSAILAKLKGGS